jgi:hypothetical protein
MEVLFIPGWLDTALGAVSWVTVDALDFGARVASLGSKGLSWLTLLEGLPWVSERSELYRDAGVQLCSPAQRPRVNVPDLVPVRPRAATELLRQLLPRLSAG